MYGLCDLLVVLFNSVVTSVLFVIAFVSWVVYTLDLLGLP